MNHYALQHIQLMKSVPHKKHSTCKGNYLSPKRDKVCSDCGQQENWCSCNVALSVDKDVLPTYQPSPTATCVMCGQHTAWCCCGLPS